MTFFDILVRKGLFLVFSLATQRGDRRCRAIGGAIGGAGAAGDRAAPAAPWQVEQVERLRLPTAVPEHLGGFGADWSRL